MRKDVPEAMQKAALWFVETTLRRLRSLKAGADDLDKRIEDVRTDGEDLEERVAAAEWQAGDLADLGDRLRLALVAVLSHAIRRQHLPQGFTFDSELWERLRDLGGEEACAAVTAEIERSKSALCRGCEREGAGE